MIFPSNHKPPEVIQPGKQTLDFPPTHVAPQLASILRGRLFSVHLMRGDHLYAPFFSKPLIKLIAVVSLVTDNFIRRIRGKAAVNCGLNQLHLVGRSAFNVSGDRKTRYVCDRHDLGAFAALCLANSKTPFFAGTKLPSMNASRISMPPRSYRSSTSSMAMRLKTPSSTHCWNRRWHVWYGGYRAGRSFHGAPVRSIHKTPFNTSRGSRPRRPLGSFFLAKDAIIGSIRLHCWSVSSILILLHNQA
jgi:hypothetical protein